MIGGVPQGADSVADPVGAAASLLFAPSRRVAAPSLGLETESSEAGSFFSVQKCSEFREVSRHSISNKCGKDSDPRDALYRGLCSCCGSYNCVKLKEERFLTRTDTPAWLSRKPALILDVDNTIVQAFSSAKQIRLESDDLRLEKCKLEASDFLDEHGLPELYTFKLTNNPDTYLLKLRPGLRTFLQKVSACFELCIYTAAAREYTNVVLAAVDPQGSLFGDRIWTKDDNPEGDNMAPKEVQNLFKKERRPAEEILVIDDRKDHWECGGRKVPHRVFQISYYSYLTRQVPALTKFYAFRPGAPHPRSSRVKFSSDSADALGEEEKSSSSSSSSSSVPARYIPEWDSEDPRVAAADADRELVYLGNLLVELYYRYTSSSHRGGVRQKSLLKVLREMRSETTAGFNILLSGFIGGKNKRDAVSRRGPSGPAAAGVTSSRQQQQQSFPSAAADAHPSEQQQQQQQHPPRVVSLPQPPGGGGTRPHPTRLSPATASPPRTSTSPDSLRLSLSASNFPFYPGAIEWIRHRTGRKRGTSRGGSDSMRRTEQSGPSRQVLMPPPPSTGGPLLHLSSDWTPSVVPHPHDRLREMGGLPITDGDPLESVSAFVARGRTHRAEQVRKWTQKGRQVGVLDPSWLTITESAWQSPPPTLFSSSNSAAWGILSQIRGAHLDMAKEEFDNGEYWKTKDRTYRWEAAGKHYVSAFDCLDQPPTIEMSLLRSGTPFFQPRGAPWDFLKGCLRGAGKQSVSRPSSLSLRSFPLDTLSAGGPLCLPSKRQAVTLGSGEQTRELKKRKWQADENCSCRIFECAQGGGGATVENSHLFAYVKDASQRDVCLKAMLSRAENSVSGSTQNQASV